jgi:transcription initiation factor TFIID subunit 12
MSSNDNGGGPGDASGTGTTSGTLSPRPALIQRNQANQLLVALKNELALAKAAGNDKAKAQQHFNKAENIKSILLQYQAQQKTKPLSGTVGNSGVTSNTASTTSGGAGGGSAISGSPEPSTVSSPNSNLSTAPQIPQISRPASVNSSGLSPITNAPSPGPSTNIVTVEKYTQINNRLQEIGSRIKYLQKQKQTETSPEKIGSYDQEISNLQVKFVQYDKICVYMKKQLTSNSPSPPATSTQEPSESNSHVNTTGPSAQQNTTLALPSPQMPNQNMSQINQKKLLPKSSPNLTTLGTTSITNHIATNPQMNTTNLPLSYSKTNISSLPMSTVKPSMGPNKILTNTRPMLTPTGNMSYMMTLQVGGQLGMQRMPTYDYSNSTYTPTNIPDNGGRVLTKRKLAEVVNSIGADEGDSKTVLEGDVEELFLDLADEFVTSITSFACKLAKHRKVDMIDTRDVQLHLERNWNIRIPGHAPDEIKATKKWQPNAEYAKKTASIEQAKVHDK